MLISSPSRLRTETLQPVSTLLAVLVGAGLCEAQPAGRASLAQLPELSALSAPRGPVRETRVCVIARIVDGDTFDCRGGPRVRPIGIDAPELSQRPFGHRARRALERLIPVGSEVRLEPDVQLFDQYGRFLAYVWRDTLLVNWAMLRDGWAVLYTLPPNVQYVEDFREAQRASREAGTGLWATEGFSCLPHDRRRGRC